MIGILILSLRYFNVSIMERIVNRNNYYIRQNFDKNKPFILLSMGLIINYC